jgi:hypothetical protein
VIKSSALNMIKDTLTLILIKLIVLIINPMEAFEKNFYLGDGFTILVCVCVCVY